MENYCIENPNNVLMLWSLYTWRFFFGKELKSQILVEFQSFLN
jgi:hypothetical protein